VSGLNQFKLYGGSASSFEKPAVPETLGTVTPEKAV
jgi:hypothetical protein